MYVDITHPPKEEQGKENPLLLPPITTGREYLIYT